MSRPPISRLPDCSSRGSSALLTPERRVGDHVVGPPWQPELRGVRLYHDHVVTEPRSQLGGMPRVRFHSGHPSAGAQQRLGDRAGARTDVEHHRAPWDRRVGDEVFSPVGGSWCQPQGRGVATAANHHLERHGGE